MPIKTNDTDVYPPALTVAYEPFTAADCARFPTLDQLVEAESAAGHGATIRNGKAYFARDLADLQTACLLLVPEILVKIPEPLVQASPWEIFGNNFGAVAGTTYLSDQSPWNPLGNNRVQPHTAWADGHITFATVNWLIIPDNVWVYVFRNDGGYDPDGYPNQVIMVP